MAIPGQANINIGAENQVAGSDTLFQAFHTIQDNFDTLFDTASPFDTFRAGDGVTVSSNVSNGVVSITNTGVTKITAGSGITVSGATGNVTISTVPQGPSGVTRVGLTSNSLSVTGGNIVSQGNFTVDLPRITTGEHFAAGEYIAPTLTVDGFGRITEIANGIGVGTVSSVGLTPGKGISVTGGPIVDSGAITVINTGVTSVQAGRGIHVSGSNGDITITATNDGTGSVSYIGVTSNNLTVTGGPITNIGNITIDLPSEFVSNLYSNAVAANYIPTYTGNLTPNNVTASGNITANNITASDTLHANVVSANTFTGTFSGNATTAGTVTTNAQPNITSVGTLASLTTTGNANVGANLNLTGNAVISGNANMYVMTANLATVQSGLEIGNDGYVLFRSQNLSGNYVAFVPPMSVGSAGLVFMLPNTIGTSSQVLGTDGSGLLQWKTPPGVGANTQIQFNDSGVSAGSTGLTFNKTTSTLTAGNLSVTGNATAVNVFATTQMTATRFISNIATGTAPFTVSSTTQVANLNSATAGTVITAAQPNITSTGTLTSLTVSGNASFTGANVSLGSVGNVKITGGSAGQVLSTNGSGVLSWVTAGGFDGSQAITISNTTVSTSTSTGALKVSGGVGVTGNLYSGNLVTTGTLYVEGALTANNSISSKGFSSQGTISATGNISSDSFVEGQYVKASTALYVYGTTNLGNVGNITITGASANGQVLTSDINGRLSWSTVVGGGGGGFDGSQIIDISNTTVSTSATTGALTVAGGVGIAGNVNSTGTISSQVSYTGGPTDNIMYATWNGSYINIGAGQSLCGVFFNGSYLFINERYWLNSLSFLQFKSSSANGGSFYVPGPFGSYQFTTQGSWNDEGGGIWSISVSNLNGMDSGAVTNVGMDSVTLLTGGKINTTTVYANSIVMPTRGSISTGRISTTDSFLTLTSYDMMFGTTRTAQLGGFGSSSLNLDNGNLVIDSGGYIAKNTGPIRVMSEIQTAEDIIVLNRGAVKARNMVTNASTVSALSNGVAEVGSRAFVTDSTVDANSTTFGQVVSVGGGSYAVPVWYDGSNWRIG